MDKRKLLTLIKKGEGTKIDFKEKINLDIESNKKELAKDVCAIANSKGGRGYLIIGVEDKTKNIVGINDAEDYLEEQIQQIVSSRCEPPIPIALDFVKFKNTKVAVISIYDSQQRPYQLRENGAFYIRRGSTTDTMRKEELVSLFQENLSLNLELCPVINSDIEAIDRDMVRKYFLMKGIKAEEKNIMNLMENTSIIFFDKERNKYVCTLGGLLVFSKFNYMYLPHNMIKITNEINKKLNTNIILQGDLLNILNKCENLLKDILPKYYPVSAIYEGIRNAILYRDYTLYYREIEIILSEKNITLTSPGVLMNGKSINSKGFYRRNMWIYEKLITLDNGERFLNTGKGFYRIKSAFKGKGKVAFINSVRENNFKIIYPGIKTIR